MLCYFSIPPEDPRHLLYNHSRLPFHLPSPHAERSRISKTSTQYSNHTWQAPAPSQKHNSTTMPSNDEYTPASWTEIFCQCLPLRKTKASGDVDIEMQMMSSSHRPTAVNNLVIPTHIVRANNPDNIQRPSHNSWWLTADDSSSGPSAPPSRSGARNPVAGVLETSPRASEVFMSGGRPVSSVYSTDAGVLNAFRVPRISPRAASYAAVLDVQAGIDARKSVVSPPDGTPASPTGSIDSIDFFSGKAAEEGFGERGERSDGRVAPIRPKRYEGVSPYIA
ncbi:hypothetical protein E4T50_10045 [Aureobasidium sp. EXF-12298]|nr:hypothetical protein E4T50_10045 [Aureobasidium sp. EXF-12298]